MSDDAALDPGIGGGLLGPLSQGRQDEYLRFLRDFGSWLAPRTPTSASANDLARYLDAKLAEGFHPNTVRKWRNMARRYFRSAHESGIVGADTLLAVQDVPAPYGSSSRTTPRPYAREDLHALRRLLDERWPALPAEEAAKYLARWRKGTGRYSRVRHHAVRLQLETIIALALECGLRRGELSTLDLDDVCDENDYIVVWKGARWDSEARTVPYTGSARERVGRWLSFRAELEPDHTSPWLNLWSEKTAARPMSLATLERLLATYLGPGWTLSRLRHTCAVGWLRAGLSVWEVQRLLGHQDLADTLPYADLLRSDLERRVERLGEDFLLSCPPPYAHDG